MAYPTTTRDGKNYLGNKHNKEVHNLRNETMACQIDKILIAGHGVGFKPDSLQQAHTEGYDNCNWCIGGSTR